MKNSPGVNNNKSTKKRTCQIVDFADPADYWIKLKESQKRVKYQDLSREPKKKMKHESDDDINCDWCACYSHKKIGTVTGRF